MHGTKIVHVRTQAWRSLMLIKCYRFNIQLSTSTTLPKRSLSSVFYYFCYGFNMIDGPNGRKKNTRLAQYFSQIAYCSVFIVSHVSRNGICFDSMFASLIFHSSYCFKSYKFINRQNPTRPTGAHRLHMNLTIVANEILFCLNRVDIMWRRQKLQLQSRTVLIITLLSSGLCACVWVCVWNVKYEWNVTTTKWNDNNNACAVRYCAILTLPWQKHLHNYKYMPPH